MGRRILRAQTPGIVDVAAHARVSPATVSRFFNSPKLVRLETRQRIEAAVAHLGYVPNAVARSLNRGNSGTVGLIVPTIDNAIFSEMAQSFSDALFRHSRTMVIASHSYDLVRESVLVESLASQRVDALALIGCTHAPETLNILQRQSIPTVYIWSYRQRQPHPCIGVDNREVGRLATQHLLALGHRDIAFAFPEARSNDRAADRRAGALAAMADAGHTVPRARRLRCPYDMDAARALGLEVLAQPDRPTAILTGNDVIAFGMRFAAQALGLRVPDDVSIVGMGDFKGSAAIEPGLTTVRIPAKRIGRLAAERLIEMIEHPTTYNDRDEQLEVELRERGSTGPATN